jgi:gluconate 5-dehydrogenase
MPAWPELQGKRAIVTGGGSGLGLEMARALAAAGARVAVCGRGSAPGDAFRGEGIASFAFDLGDADELRDGLAEVIATLGGVDTLIGNAGMRDRRPLAEIDDDAINRLFDVNLAANVRLARGVAPLMAAAGGGAMVFVTSIAGERPSPNNTTYCASKGGLAALTRALASELGPLNIRCNAIAPGFFATEFNRPLWAVEDDRITRRIPLRRWGKPAEIAGAALFLASDAASYINGHVLVVDGGVSTSL